MTITVCIFANEPRPQLVASIGADAAAALAHAFLADTWALVSNLSWARPVIASNTPRPGYAVVWPQGEGALDARLERVLARALHETPAGAIALGADSPGLPVDILELAAGVIDGGEAVLGRTTDGGFYLLGVPVYPPGLLTGVVWTTATTARTVAKRLAAHALLPFALDEWFDIERVEDLVRLRALLATSPERAPITAALLKLGL